MAKGNGLCGGGGCCCAADGSGSVLCCLRHGRRVVRRDIRGLWDDDRGGVGGGLLIRQVLRPPWGFLERVL